ncbi:hypothetical protein PF002_g31545 [Phytophthora fragariae]|uniref:Uncharacterized protein n=1 Tax=Phytophthora fragariae TaxID=53985 RepID=A0A6A3GMG7_9STRA|nr:hypothetical protein PF011_g30678 [Phytophthora fragariae]KAE9164678.1 hypothetical protein PF002_g31545 [Phytophthora fragariae]
MAKVAVAVVALDSMDLPTKSNLTARQRQDMVWFLFMHGVSETVPRGERKSKRFIGI